MYTHAIFQAQVESFRSLYAIEPGEIDLCTFPLFALFAPALGMTAIVPDMDPTRPARVDPAQALRGDRRFRRDEPVRLAGPVPPAWARGRDGAVRQLPTLKRIISAVRRSRRGSWNDWLRVLDPPAEIHTPYGATESLPVASIGSREILGETRHATDSGMGVCVGRPVEGIEARIIQIRDDPIPTWSDDLLVPDGEIGEIVVAGPVVTREYFNRPEATGLAKIADPDRQLFYHRMGDLGYRDEQGTALVLRAKVASRDPGRRDSFHHSLRGDLQHPSRGLAIGPGRCDRRGQVVPVICVEPIRRLTRARNSKVLRQELLDRGRCVLRIRGGSRRSCFIVRFRSTFATTPRFSARSWPSGPRGDCHESGEIGPVLVTGGGGFLGTALIKMLRAAWPAGPQPGTAILSPSCTS